MGHPRYSHVTIPVEDVAEALAFYEYVFGMEHIPSPAFERPVEWVRCGGIQLHLLQSDTRVPGGGHIALHVDEFEEVYLALLDHDEVSFRTLSDRAGGAIVNGIPPVFTLPSGTVQLYVEDPYGNGIEVNHPDIDAIDESVVTNVVERRDVAPPKEDADADIYGQFGLSRDMVD